MSFARPGQIVVSRSYYDVVSNLASEYAKLFTYEGSRTDKHVREHEIYVVGHHEEAMKKARDSMKDRASSTTTNVKRAPTAASPTGTGTVTLTIPNFVQDKKKLTVVAGVLAGVVAVLGFLVATKKSEPPAILAPVIATAPVTAPAAGGAQRPAPIPAAEAPKAAPAAGDGKAEPPKAEAAKPAGPQVHAKVEPSKADTDKGAVPAAPAAPAVPPATLIFAIQPWGEVFVNGKASGVSPPVKSIKLAPGKYKIEVRNTTFAAYTENIDLKARDEVTIRYKFQ